MKSSPTSSASRPSRRLSSQVACQRSSIFVTAIPDEQFAENRPSLRSAPSSRIFATEVSLSSVAGKAAHAARVHEERGAIGDGSRDDATDEDDVVASVVL